MTSKKMEFLFGDRVLQLQVLDILKAPVEVIVNPANGALIHGGALALAIQNGAGIELEKESKALVREHGQLESGMAAFTTAGKLPYKAVIHAVGPQQGEGGESLKLEQVFLRSLLLCETNDWRSVAFPAISTGVFSVPVSVCASASYKAITHFWDARSDCCVDKIIICLTENNFDAFFTAFREESFDDSGADTAHVSMLNQGMESMQDKTGIIHLDENELDIDDEVNDWFK